MRTAGNFWDNSPKRACSSTLVAISFANNVRPRTIPIAVSSHEVSIPSTKGSVTAPTLFA
jgi:hypothetical protein